MVTMAKTTLKRAIQKMPSDIRKLLTAQGLTKAYSQRPPYQRNDYLSWIGRAKLPATRTRRIRQMLNELSEGNVYMKMAWSPRN